MQLVEVDLVATQALEALLERVADERRRPVVRALDVALALPRRVDVVAELGAHDDVGVVAERLVEQRLATTLAVGVGGVVEGDAVIFRVAEDGDGFIVRVLAPPAGGQGPHAEAHFRDFDATASERARLHALSVARVPEVLMTAISGSVNSERKRARGGGGMAEQIRLTRLSTGGG